MSFYASVLLPSCITNRNHCSLAATIPPHSTMSFHLFFTPTMLLTNTTLYNQTIKHNACVGPTTYFIYKIRVDFYWTLRLSCIMRNDSSGMIHQEWFIRNDSPGMIHQEWFIRNDSSGMIHKKWFTRNDSSGMIHQEWLIGNDSPEMIHQKWFIRNDSSGMFNQEWFIRNDSWWWPQDSWNVQ